MLLATLILLTVSGIAVMLAGAGREAERPGAPGVLAAAAVGVLGVALLLAVLSWGESATVFGALRAGPLTSLGSAILCVIGLLVTAGAMANPEKYRAGPGEFFAFVIFTVLGGILIVGASNLLVLYLGVELSSYSTYILVGYYRDDRYSNEAAGKYFLLGSVASAFLLFGTALVYAGTAFVAEANPFTGAGGATPGSLDYAGIAQSILQQGDGLNPLLLPGLALILVGFGFKLALVPFHAWTPDAYQGAPSMVAS